MSRAIGVGKELGKVKTLLRSGEAGTEILGREGHKLVGTLIVFEVVVIVLGENGRDRPEVSAIETCYLFVQTPCQGDFVGRSKDRLVFVERAVLAIDSLPIQGVVADPFSGERV